VTVWNRSGRTIVLDSPGRFTVIDCDGRVVARGWAQIWPLYEAPMSMPGPVRLEPGSSFVGRCRIDAENLKSGTYLVQSSYDWTVEIPTERGVRLTTCPMQDNILGCRECDHPRDPPILNKQSERMSFEIAR
jgi:hypothetical protein